MEESLSQQTVPKTKKEGTPADVELEELGDEIANDWRKLGRRLEVCDSKIEEINKAHDQLSEKGYHMLKHWKQEKGSAATYQALCEALQHRLVRRKDLAEKFCYINAPADPVPEGTVTGEVSGAAASTLDSGHSTGVKQKSVELGVLSWKTHCVSATSRYCGKQDHQEQSETVNKYIAQKIGEVIMKGTFDLSSVEGLEDFHAYLRGHLSLVVISFENSSIKITVKCRTLEILECLWEEYCSGRLNAEAERCLITENVKEELGMETIKFATTVLEEDYLACKFSLTENAAAADPVPEGTVTGEVSGAAASTRDSGDSTGVRSAEKRKSVERAADCLSCAVLISSNGELTRENEEWRKRNEKLTTEIENKKHELRHFVERFKHQEEQHRSDLSFKEMEVNKLDTRTEIAAKKDDEVEALKKKLRECERQLQEKINSSPKNSRDAGRVEYSSTRGEKWQKEQWQVKENQLRSKQDDKLFAMRKHYEQQLKNNTEVLQKNNTDLQNLLLERTEIAAKKDEEVGALKKKLRECERQLQEKIDSSLKDSRDTDKYSYNEQLAKTKQAMEEKSRELERLKERTSVERELEEKDKLLQESERKTKCLEEECWKLKKELEKKEKEISEIEKVQEEKISAVKKELENKVKEISDKANQLQKEKDDLQKIFIYGEYQKALKEHMSSHDDITNDLAVRDKEIQEYMERCAAMAERMVNMDQRRDENTQSANRQSDLEKEYRNDFRDGMRVDAIDVIEAKLNETRRTKQSNADDQVKAYRLACYIFEISYECSLKAKDTFLTFYSSLLDTLVTEAPTIGSSDVIYKKLIDFTPSRTRKGVKEESSSEVMVLVKEEAGRHNLDSLVKMIKKEIKEKWRQSQCKEENLPSYDKSLKNKLKPYIEYCSRFAWRIVTQVPPLKIDFKSTTYNPASHNESQAFSSSASQHPPERWASMQQRPKMVKCYVWPTLHDFDGRVIEKGDVVLEEQSTGRFATIV